MAGTSSPFAMVELLIVKKIVLIKFEHIIKISILEHCQTSQYVKDILFGFSYRLL